jgi:hypothetical protein
VHLIDGVYWFRLEYAARLLGTTAAKLQQRVYAGTLAATQTARGLVLVAEATVTEERRLKGRSGLPPAEKETPKLIDAERGVTGFYERPQESPVLPMSSGRDGKGWSGQKPPT